MVIEIPTWLLWMFGGLIGLALLILVPLGIWAIHFLSKWRMF